MDLPGRRTRITLLLRPPTPRARTCLPMSPRPLPAPRFDFDPAPAPPPRRSSAAGWLIVIVVLLKLLLFLAPLAATFVLVTSLCAAAVEDPLLRAALGAFACLFPPLLLHNRTAALLRRTRFRAPDFETFLAAGNLALAALLAFGFADDCGRALRRHGDWFLGERNGAATRLYRAAIDRAAAYLERFDPLPELAPIILPPDPAKIPEGPQLPGQHPSEAAPTIIGWFHPLAGPRRSLPWSESRRFGAVRPQPRPVECELGHCGVDLGSVLGEPVFAIFDGVVERIERAEDRGGRAGRYLRIGHTDGTVISRYIHLDSIRADLREGARVRGGELLGRLGRSGVHNSGPHLHFGLSLRPGGPGASRASERYIDPEPLLRTWQLPTLDTVALAAPGAFPLPGLPAQAATPPSASDGESADSPSE